VESLSARSAKAVPLVFFDHTCRLNRCSPGCSVQSAWCNLPTGPTLLQLATVSPNFRQYSDCWQNANSLKNQALASGRWRRARQLLECVLISNPRSTTHGNRRTCVLGAPYAARISEAIAIFRHSEGNVAVMSKNPFAALWRVEYIRYKLFSIGHLRVSVLDRIAID
jgi:hypothetical protein